MGTWGSLGALELGRWLVVTVCVQVCAIGQARAVSFSTAYVNVSLTPAGSNRTVWDRSEIGLYGADSPTATVAGTLYQADPIHACANDTRFVRPVGNERWIALIQRGHGCTFTQKINAAANSGASGAVIFNEPGTNNNVIQMSHPGTTIVAIMISDVRGIGLWQLLHEGVSVSMTIELGLQHGIFMSHYSILFISIAFFIITTATIAYFIFYLAKRLNNIRLHNQKQKQMKATAKKALGQLEVRTLKNGDQETEPDADSCAVCIESYKVGDVLSVLTCSHSFHKACIEPWLMEHRTCPMCKCDVLRALGVEVNNEELCDSSVSTHLHPFHEDTESTHPEHITDVLHDSTSSENHPDQATNQQSSDGLEVVCVDMQQYYDNSGFDNESCS